MKYFLQGTNERQYTEVSKDEFVDAERLNGFYNTLGKPGEPATSGFVGMYHRGHVEFDSVLDFHVPQDREISKYAFLREPTEEERSADRKALEGNLGRVIGLNRSEPD